MSKIGNKDWYRLCLPSLYPSLLPYSAHLIYFCSHVDPQQASTASVFVVHVASYANLGSLSCLPALHCTTFSSVTPHCSMSHARGRDNRGSF